MLKRSKKFYNWWHQNVAKRWAIYGSPARPSQDECNIIRGFIVSKHKNHPRILVLGATPEYRDLAHACKAEVTCIDISLEMIMSMPELMKHKKLVSQEIWIKANWLDMPLSSGYYDFVIGDLVVTNIPLESQTNFLAEIRRILKPNGYFITREYYPPQKRTIDLIVDETFKRGLSTKSINLLTWDLLAMAYNRQNKTATSTRMNNVLHQALMSAKTKQRKAQINRLALIVDRHYPPGKKWWILGKDEEKLLVKYFKIISIKYGHDHPRVAECPIYILKKQK